MKDDRLFVLRDEFSEDLWRDWPPVWKMTGRRPVLDRELHVETQINSLDAGSWPKMIKRLERFFFSSEMDFLWEQLEWKGIKMSTSERQTRLSGLEIFRTIALEKKWIRLNEECWRWSCQARRRGWRPRERFTDTVKTDMKTRYGEEWWSAMDENDAVVTPSGSNEKQSWTSDQ